MQKTFRDNFLERKRGIGTRRKIYTILIYSTRVQIIECFNNRMFVLVFLADSDVSGVEGRQRDVQHTIKA